MHDPDGRFVVVWDAGPMHKGAPIHQLMDHFADRLCLEALPPWAPMLNPTEPLWDWLKYDTVVQLRPARCSRTRREGCRRVGDGRERSEILDEPVSRLGTPAPADITFLTSCSPFGIDSCRQLGQPAWQAAPVNGEIGVQDGPVLSLACPRFLR
jgi:transposase